MSREERSHKESNWICFLCSETCEANTHADLNEPIKESDKGIKPTTRSSVRILQWNAEGLKYKVDELTKRLQESDIDVAAIQESWLTKSDKTPTIKGYVAIREDRKVNIQRGGLIFYIKDSIYFERVGYITTRGHEIHTIRIRMSKSKWLTITNFYIPPPQHARSGQTIEYDTSVIPFSPSSLICGDFNAHHPVWDSIQPEDDRGLLTLEWAYTNELTILNDPNSPTRHSKVTGNGSSPDLTIAGANWSDKCTWAVDEEEIGGSDHLPVITTVQASISHRASFNASPRWRSNGIDWAAFRNQVDQNLKKQTTPNSLTQRATAFTTTIINAARKHVRKVKPAKAKNAQITPKVRNLIKKRNTLRKSISTKKKEWLQACTEVSNAKREAKREQWEEVVNSAISDLDERSMWRFIKSLNGAPATNSPNEAMKIGGKTVISAKKKAEAFAKHYASVSRLSFSKSERDFARRLKKLTRSNKGQLNIPAFTMVELKTALSNMRRKGAPGPDDITPAFLKELGPVALQELLDLSNNDANVLNILLKYSGSGL